MKTNDPPAGADTLSGISAEAQTILPTGREGSNVLDMQTRLAPESRVEGNDTLEWRFVRLREDLFCLHFVRVLDFYLLLAYFFFNEYNPFVMIFYKDSYWLNTFLENGAEVLRWYKISR